MAQSPETPATAATPNGPGVGSGRAPGARARWRLMLGLAFAVIVIGAGVIYWRSTAWESTDDAQIDGFVFPVSSRVSGHVLRVMVDDNQYV